MNETNRVIKNILIFSNIINVICGIILIVAFASGLGEIYGYTNTIMNSINSKCVTINGQSFSVINGNTDDCSSFDLSKTIEDNKKKIR